jgi:UDP-N-acetylglucosamine 2-epimerase (non-hydrolysing)
MAGMEPRCVTVVLGTRPEAIKLAPLIRALGDICEVVYTGQHYDPALAAEVLDDLGLPAPDDTLGVGGRHRGRQIGDATSALTERISSSGSRAVVVQGDTNAALSGALAANACQVPLVHVESGLRSFDRAMPEEHNRVLIDHLADVCAAPTEGNRQNLLSERIPPERIKVTGNTIVESVAELLPPPSARKSEVGRRGLEPNQYVLATLHRPENVDQPRVLIRLLDELAACPLPVVLPMHPRTRAQLSCEGSFPAAQGSLVVVDPLPPRTFLALAAEARLLVTDSGGLQEEATILKRRALVVRRSTERPEALGSFSELVLKQAHVWGVSG